MNPTQKNLIVGLLLLLLFVHAKNNDGTLSNPSKVTFVTYVYEKNESGSPPPYVLTAIDKLNHDPYNIRSTTFEDDTNNGTGATPKQYVKPLEAAKKEGMPSVVGMKGEAVSKVVKSPQKEQDVLDVAK